MSAPTKLKTSKCKCNCKIVNDKYETINFMSGIWESAIAVTDFIKLLKMGVGMYTIICSIVLKQKLL
jgi:hypothetical protein